MKRKVKIYFQLLTNIQYNWKKQFPNKQSLELNINTKVKNIQYTYMCKKAHFT